MCMLARPCLRRRSNITAVTCFYLLEITPRGALSLSVCMHVYLCTFVYISTSRARMFAHACSLSKCKFMYVCMVMCMCIYITSRARMLARTRVSSRAFVCTFYLRTLINARTHARTHARTRTKSAHSKSQTHTLDTPKTALVKASEASMHTHTLIIYSTFSP